MATFLDDLDVEGLSLSSPLPDPEELKLLKNQHTHPDVKIKSKNDTTTTTTNDHDASTLVTPLHFPECRISPRIHRVAQQLQTLPTELIEPVISELQTSTLIELAIVGDANLRAIISASPSWRPLFNRSTGGLDIHRLIRMYSTYSTLANLSHGEYLNFYYANSSYDASWDQGNNNNNNNNNNIHPYQWRNEYTDFKRDSPYLLYRADLHRFCKKNNLSKMLNAQLEFLYSTIINYTDINCEDRRRRRAGWRRYRKYLPYVSIKRIVDQKRYLDAAGVPDSLLPLSAEPTLEDANTLALKASALLRVEEAFNDLKEKELLTLADIVERHPTRLKMILDPREGPEASAAWPKIISKLRSAAVMAKTSGMFMHRCRQAAQAWFISSRVRIVPRDIFLHLFLLVMKHHPPESYAYSENIAADIDTALNGLQTVYFSSLMPIDESTGKERERPVIKRICIRAKNSPPAFSAATDRPLTTGSNADEILKKYQSEGLEEDGEYFEDTSTLPAISSIPPERASFTLPTKYDHRRCCPTEPHDPRELEWLSAFLSCVEYFETKFPDLYEQVESHSPPPCKISLIMYFSSSRKPQDMILSGGERYERRLASDQVMKQVCKMKATVEAKDDDEFWEEYSRKRAEIKREAEERWKKRSG